MNFITELKRRNVIRMAGLYLVGAWLLTQVAGTVLPMYEAPGWIARSIVTLLAIGFIPAMIFAWIFELTPDGLKRDSEIPEAQSIAPQTAQKMNRLIAALLVLAVVFFGVDKFVLTPHREAALITETTKEITEKVAQQEKTENEKSIAVLAFSDLSPNKDQEYFSDGMAEEILNSLVRVKDLKVAGRTSSFFFKGKNEDIRKIGKALGVANVLEGSVRKQGEKVRITAQLIRVSDGFHLWSEKYDGDLKDVFALQESIAQAITSELQIILQGEQKMQLVNAGTTNTEAYQHYLKGRFYWNKRDEENLRKAIEQFKAAADKDSNYALAFSGLSDSYAILPYYTYVASTEVLPQAKTYATRALEIDDSLGEAHASLGYYYFQSWNWAEAEKSFKQSIELNPNYATARRGFGLYLITVGRYDEAEIELKRAIEIEPLSLIVYNNLAELYTRKGDLNAAIEQCQRAIELDPNWYFVRTSLALIYLKQGRNAEAIDEAEKAVELSKHQNLPLGILGYIYARAGRQTDAIKIVEELKERYQKQQAVGLDIARVFGGLGDKDQAFVWLEKEFQSRNQKLPVWFGLDMFDPLRDDPRYKALVKKVGIPE